MRSRPSATDQTSPGQTTASQTAGAKQSRSRALGKQERARLARLLSYTRPYRGALIGGMVAVAVAGALSLAFPLLVRDLLNSAFAPDAASSPARAALDRTAVLLFVLMAVQAAFNYLRTKLLGSVGESVVADLRKALFGHLLSLEVDFFETRKTGEVLSRLTSDVATVQASVSQALAQILNQALTLFGGVGVLLFLNWRLTLVMLAVVPAAVAVAALFGRALRRASTRFQDSLAHANADAEEAIAGIRVVKSFTAETFETARYGRRIQEALDVALARVRLRALFAPTLILGFSSAMAVVLWYGGRLALSGQLLGGDLVAFLLITVFVAGSLGTFTGLWAQLQESLGASERIFEILDQQPTLSQPVAAGAARERAVVKGKAALSFRGVSFTYPTGETAVLKDIELEVAAGEVVALVGPSGSGKSTLVGLVPRFFDPTRGSVALAGTDLRELDLQALRKSIAIVPQETYLFSGSVAENIRYGRTDASDEEVRRAAADADALDFIEELPNGFDTEVGERGVRLSGGQRQRIAIARALIKDPAVLILDEATSSLDSESESQVQAALTRLMQGRTTLVIAHRLATIRGADRIVVLDGGRIVDQGDHAALMARGGLYADLHELQFAT
ncbi:MAG: ATP-binding cassette domain-containing protein [Trueperaceae bacterium]|nr:ATP-binding cassette domain-containing protein [Trueperaceae bacterium]